MYRLRELARKDLIKINEWRNDKELIAQLGAPFRYINQDVDDMWYNSYMSQRSDTIRCAIVEENDEIVGLVSLTNLNYINQCAEFHIMIGDKNSQGKGVGFFAVQEMLNHAFYNMNLRRIELTALACNVRAQHLYEKVGFVREGIMRKACYKNGEFVDVYCYAILKEDYSQEK